jgi:hypothetical protein
MAETTVATQVAITMEVHTRTPLIMKVIMEMESET